MLPKDWESREDRAAVEAALRAAQVHTSVYLDKNKVRIKAAVASRTSPDWYKSMDLRREEFFRLDTRGFATAGGMVDLRNATRDMLTGMRNIAFENVDISSSDLNNVRIYHSSIRGFKATKVDFSYSSLNFWARDGVLERCDFRESYLDCFASSLHFVKCRFLRLQGLPSLLEGCRFDACKFNQSSWGHSIIVDCEFRDCQFTDAMMEKCTFERCRFEGGSPEGK